MAMAASPRACVLARVVGVDLAELEIERARSIRSRLPTLKNLSFEVADIYALPSEDESFDRAFRHALLEHLAEPLLALREIHRVLKPGGLVGLASADWSGSILLPPSETLIQAIASDRARRHRIDIDVGRKFGEYLTVAGFDIVSLSARYENHRAISSDVAQVVASCLFAESWISAVARKSA